MVSAAMVPTNRTVELEVVLRHFDFGGEADGTVGAYLHITVDLEPPSRMHFSCVDPGMECVVRDCARHDF